MKNTIEKIAGLALKFTENFKKEIERDLILKRDIKKINGVLFGNQPVKKVYSALQYTDHLITNSLKDYCKKPKNMNAIDRFFEKTFYIPQYYGGTRDFYGGVCNFPIEKYINLNTLKEYRIIQKIENEKIQNLFERLFDFKELKFVSAEATESLKRFKNEILNQEKEWSHRKIILDDIRLVETESILIKNLKKTIKTNFEISAILSGKYKNKMQYLKQSFSCSFEFVKENEEWVVHSFSFNKL